MKIVLTTQIRENYAAHTGFEGKYHWKYKGGNTYVVEGVTCAQAQDKEFWARVEASVTDMNDYFEEYVIGTDLVDDDRDASEFCEEWESPYILKIEDGELKGSCITRPGKYDYWSGGIVEKRETWTQVAGEKKDYVLRYLKEDGTVTDWQGNVVKEAA